MPFYGAITARMAQVRAAVPMYLLSRKIKALGFKVVMSGEGADEVFGGYLYFHKAPNAAVFHRYIIHYKPPPPPPPLTPIRFGATLGGLESYPGGLFMVCAVKAIILACCSCALWWLAMILSPWERLPSPDDCSGINKTTNAVGFVRQGKARGAKNHCCKLALCAISQEQSYERARGGGERGLKDMN